MEPKTTSQVSRTSPLNQVKTLLQATATLRGQKMDVDSLSLYANRLVKEPFEDLETALEKLSEMPRQNYESAIPEIGGLLALVKAMTVARHNRMAENLPVWQEQVCPKCGERVGGTVPRGEQGRTWCVPCQSYRKIIPEDLKLSETQWELICAALDAHYHAWVKNGSKYEEHCPTVDRETAIEQAPNWAERSGAR
jgi:hypothetical protein